MDEYLLHVEYYKSVRGEDGVEPLEALESQPQTDMGSKITPAHLQTWPTLYLYPDAREGLLGVQSCQQPSEPPKCVKLMLRIPIPQGQPMVSWTVRLNYWPSCYRGPKIQM